MYLLTDPDYEIIIDKRALKDLRSIPEIIAKKFKKKIKKTLSNNPFVGEPLSGPFKGLMKLRFGAYRCIYTIQDNKVIIILIGDRKDCYDSLCRRYG